MPPVPSLLSRFQLKEIFNSSSNTISQVIKHEREQDKEDPRMDENDTMDKKKLLVPYLPEEIIVEIHSRLPIKSLLKFKCVSKPWSVLYNNPKLIEMILFNFNIILVHKSNMYSIESESSSSSSLLDSMEKIHCPDVERYDRTGFVGSCNGLVCIDDHWRTEFRLWNPSTGDSKLLPNPPDEIKPSYCLIGYGFGYDSKSDDYKFVRFTTNLRLKKSEAKIYSLRSDSWKRIPNIPWLLDDPLSMYGVFCNGALHWKSSFFSKDLIALSMTDEVIRRIAPPEKSNFEQFHDHSCIDVLNGCLSMLYSDANRSVEVWLMKDYGIEESWTKTYRIPKLKSIDNRISGSFRLMRIKCLKSGEMLLEVSYNNYGPHAKALVLYDPKKEIARTLIEEEDEYNSSSLSFHSYVQGRLRGKAS